MHPRLLQLFILGSVLLLMVSPAHSQTFNVLYNLGTVVGDPGSPEVSGTIAQGRDGNLYSTGPRGGTGCGAIFRITPDGTLTNIHSFDSSGIEGCSPFAGLTLGTDGNFYGTTDQLGTSCCGTIFKVTPSGVLTVLHNFNGLDGANPWAPPIQGPDSNWYGTTTTGGEHQDGTVYKLTLGGLFTTLDYFDGENGQAPSAPLLLGIDGNLYGTARFGGSRAYGTIFKLDKTSGQFTVLHSFDAHHGADPSSPLIQTSDGNFYGTAVSNGGDFGGVAFKISPSGTFSVVHNMNPTTDGDAPFAGLVQASDGNFYGANAGFGSLEDGTLFSLTPGGVFTNLYNFDGTTGSIPMVTLVQHTNGILYGDTLAGGTGTLDCLFTTCGVFYSLNANLPPFAGLVTTVGKVGAEIGILGQGFSGSSVVQFGTAQATIAAQDPTFITAIVPNGATTGIVTVTTGGTTLPSKTVFRVTPQLTSFAPSRAVEGQSVTITGVSLSQTSQVIFGHVEAKKFTIDSDTQITAEVPSGAISGRIIVVTAGGAATSRASFNVLPSIKSFTPTSGPVGTVVTITGGGFRGALDVSFNGVSASFTFNSDSQVTATVPSGATTGPISVTTPGGTATSTTNFTVN